ncbi:MAG: hypothetical protein R2860_09575 [Desulfobacterales bacterium]
MGERSSTRSLRPCSAYGFFWRICFNGTLKRIRTWATLHCSGDILTQLFKIEGLRYYGVISAAKAPDLVGDDLLVISENPLPVNFACR